MEQAIAKAPGPIWQETLKESWSIYTSPDLGKASLISSARSLASSKFWEWTAAIFSLPASYMSLNLVSISWLMALIITFLACLAPLHFENASSFSPWIWRTGLILSTSPKSAAAGVIRPPFFRYFKVSIRLRKNGGERRMYKFTYSIHSFGCFILLI